MPDSPITPAIVHCLTTAHTIHLNHARAAHVLCQGSAGSVHAYVIRRARNHAKEIERALTDAGMLSVAAALARDSAAVDTNVPSNTKELT